MKSRITLGLPVLNGKPLTTECVKHLADTVVDPENFRLVIVDNNSSPRYDEKFDVPFEVDIITNSVNMGFYYPIRQLQERYDDAIIAVMHNDVFIWEKGWDDRLRDAFEDDYVGIVGFCGSDEVDPAGGRGAGTMCNFRGEKGQLQEHTGKRVTGEETAVILDSMFMAFWADIIPDLEIDENVPLAHFVDKVLPIRALRLGFKTLVLGVEIDHMGGQTLVGEQQFEMDARAWCARQGLPIVNDNGGLSLYLESELRFKVECAEYIPSKVLPDGRVHKYRNA